MDDIKRGRNWRQEIDEMRLQIRNSYISIPKSYLQPWNRFWPFSTIPPRSNSQHFSDFRDDIMLQRIRPTHLTRLLAVSLCAFVALPLPQFFVLTHVQAVESECPCHEDKDTSEKELVVGSSVRRRLSRSVGDTGVRRTFGPVGRPQKAASYMRLLPAIVGHQLANGLCAPLLI